MGNQQALTAKLEVSIATCVMIMFTIPPLKRFNDLNGLPLENGKEILNRL